MPRQKPTWYWLAPCLVAVGHWERLLYATTYGHSPIAHAEYQYIDDHIMPWYWTTNAVAALILLVFGWKSEEIPAWLLAIALFFIGWEAIQPTFLA